MYTRTNYKSKVALKRAIADGATVHVFSPGPFPCPTDGRVTLEGPHYPAPHRWYATAQLRDGTIIPGSVK